MTNTAPFTSPDGYSPISAPPGIDARAYGELNRTIDLRDAMTSMLDPSPVGLSADAVAHDGQFSTAERYYLTPRSTEREIAASMRHFPTAAGDCSYAEVGFDLRAVSRADGSVVPGGTITVVAVDDQASRVVTIDVSGDRLANWPAGVVQNAVEEVVSRAQRVAATQINVNIADLAAPKMEPAARPTVVPPVPPMHFLHNHEAPAAGDGIGLEPLGLGF